MQEIIYNGGFLRFYILRRKSRHGGTRPIVQSRAVHADEQAGVTVHFYNAFDAPLIEVDVLLRWHRHEAVRQEGDGIDARLEFPLVPPIVVLGGGKLE